MASSRDKRKSKAPPANASPIPGKVLFALFTAFAGALGMKAWEERTSQTEALLAQQSREAMAIAGYVRSEVVRINTVMSMALQNDSSRVDIVEQAGLKSLSRASAPADEALASLYDDQHAGIFATTPDGEWWRGLVDLDALTPLPGESRDFSLVKSSQAEMGGHVSVSDFNRYVQGCAPIGNTSMSACVTRDVPLLTAADYNRLLIYLLLIAAPALAVFGLVNTVKSNISRLETETSTRKEIETRWKELEVGGNNGYWTWHSDTGLINLRDKTADMLGLGQEQSVTLKEFVELVNPSQRATVLSALETAKSAPNFQIQFRGSDAQSEHHFQMQGGPLEGGLSGILTDITDRVRAEQRSRMSEHLARSVVDAYPGPFAAWDQRHRLLIWNKTFARQFQLPERVLRAGASYDLVMAEAAKQIRIERPIQGTQTGREFLLLSDIWLNFYDRPTFGGGLVSVGIDISALKNQEESLLGKEKKLRRLVLELERMQGQSEELAAKYADQKFKAEKASQSKSVFLANMSHELRTPLNAINGFSEMLIREIYGPLGDERYKGYAEDILTSGQHLLDMINDILDMAKIEAGKMSITTRMIDPIEAVDSAVRMIRRRAEDKELELTLQAENDIPEIEGDHRAIKQMVLNLVSNAIKFTDAGGMINVKILREDQFIRVSVADTGIGIPKQDIPRLAQPFEQSSADENRNSKGSGLGLSLTKSFAEMHGGYLEIESEYGVGTTVSIVLPIDPTQIKATPSDKVA